MPKYIWAPLRGHFAELARVKLRYGVAGGSGRIQYRFQGKDRWLSATFRRAVIELQRT